MVSTAGSMPTSPWNMILPMRFMVAATSRPGAVDARAERVLQRCPEQLHPALHQQGQAGVAGELAGEDEEQEAAEADPQQAPDQAEGIADDGEPGEEQGPDAVAAVERLGPIPCGVVEAQHPPDQ